MNADPRDTQARSDLADWLEVKEPGRTLDIKLLRAAQLEVQVDGEGRVTPPVLPRRVAKDVLGQPTHVNIVWPLTGTPRPTPRLVGRVPVKRDGPYVTPCEFKPGWVRRLFGTPDSLTREEVAELEGRLDGQALEVALNAMRGWLDRNP